MKYILSIILLVSANYQLYAQTEVNHYAISILCSVDSLLNIEGAPISYTEKCKYAEIDELNGWVNREKYCEKAYLRTREDFIDDFLSNAKLQLLGEISINSNCQRLLLSCQNRDEIVIYIVSLNEGNLKIETDICRATKTPYYTHYVPNIFISCLSNGIFMKCAFDVSDDLLYKGKPICSAEILEVFYFDTQGDIVLFHNSSWLE